MKYSLKKNAVLNVIKTITTIIFPLITFPYITRVLKAEAIGKINFGNSIISYFSLIAALGISSYAIREGAIFRDKREKIDKFAGQVFSINIITTVISYAALAVLLLLWPKLYNYRQLIIVQSLIIAFTTIGVDWVYSIYEDYLYITIRSIVVQIISLVLLLSFIRTEQDYIKYALIIVLSTAGANIFNFIHARKYVKLSVSLDVDFKKHLLPMLILFCNTLAITIYVNSDITILGVLKGDYAVGIYSVAVKIYSIIKQIINALVIVTLPRLTSLLSNDRVDEYNHLLMKIFKALFILLLPSIFGIFLLSREITVIIAGSQYVEGYIALRILSVAIGFSLFASFLTTSVLLPHKKEKYILKATILSALVNLGLNFILVPVLSEKGAALTTVIAELLVLVISIHYAKGDIVFVPLKKTMLSSAVGCFFIAVICIAMKYIISNLMVCVLVSVAGSVIAYSTVLLLFRNELFLEMKNIIFKKLSYKSK